MLLLFLFVLLLFVCLFVLGFFCLFFFRDGNMIYVGIVEFRYYVVIIILVNLGKP